MIVRHSSGQYPIEFVSLQEAVSCLPENALIVTDTNVASLYRSKFVASQRWIEVSPGEGSKSISVWGDLQSRLANMGANRKSTIVAFGGGVVGDLAGFLAATYMRGVPMIQIPTTLLAQVDSSVGGKVGIDLNEGKNLVGAFYPPNRVFICDETLDTLSEREFRNGMAEVWKYGFIFDAALLKDLEKGQVDRADVVKRCIDLKRGIVETDEFETTGQRAKLNFGHTVGHAIEKLTGYGPVLHGEAISIGMVVEARLGKALGLTEAGVSEVVENSLASQGLPTTSVVLSNIEMLVEAMKRDKKAGKGRMAFSLLTRLGDCRLVEDVPEADVRRVLAKS